MEPHYKTITYVKCRALGLVLVALLLPLLSPAQGFDSCVEYSLKNSFPQISVGEKSQLFVRCNSTKSEPQAGQVRPQYPAFEIKRIAKSYEAVMDCLDINATLLFPKMMAESGFHTTIQNPQGDAGIGQLTIKAIRDVEANMATYKNLIQKSPKKSCQHIKNFAAAYSEFWRPIAGTSKCSVMSKTLNPMKNLLYAGIFQKLNEKYVQAEMNKLEIPKLLNIAGFPERDLHDLKSLMVTLGYNTGGAVAVRNLKEYLVSRADYVNRKSLEFSEKSILSMSDVERTRTLSLVTPADFDFTDNLEKFKLRREKFKKELKMLNPTMNEAYLNKLVGLKLRNESTSTYTFPEWLMVWQSHGGPGYLSGLARFASRLDSTFGVGVCSNKNFYRLEI